jgi:hypothetical protein
MFYKVSKTICFYVLYNTPVGPFKSGMSNSKHFAGRKSSFEAEKSCLRAEAKKIIDLDYVSKAF